MDLGLETIQLERPVEERRHVQAHHPEELAREVEYVDHAPLSARQGGYEKEPDKEETVKAKRPPTGLPVGTRAGTEGPEEPRHPSSPTPLLRALPVYVRGFVGTRLGRSDTRDRSGGRPRLYRAPPGTTPAATQDSKETYV